MVCIKLGSPQLISCVSHTPLWTLFFLHRFLLVESPDILCQGQGRTRRCPGGWQWMMTQTGQSVDPIKLQVASIHLKLTQKP